MARYGEEKNNSSSSIKCVHADAHRWPAQKNEGCGLGLGLLRGTRNLFLNGIENCYFQFVIFTVIEIIANCQAPTVLLHARSPRTQNTPKSGVSCGIAGLQACFADFYLFIHGSCIDFKRFKLVCKCN